MTDLVLVRDGAFWQTATSGVSSNDVSRAHLFTREEAEALLSHLRREGGSPTIVERDEVVGLVSAELSAAHASAEKRDRLERTVKRLEAS